MADQLFLERFLWFDAQARQGKHPGAAKLAAHFGLSSKTTQRSIEFFCDRLNAPLKYDPFKNGYYYVDASVMMQILSRGSQVRVLAPEWLKEKVPGEIVRMSRLY